MKQLWSYPNVISTTCKDLSHVTCFNCEKKGSLCDEVFRAQKERLRRLVTVLTTSTLMTGALCYPGTRSLYSIPGSSPQRLRRSYDDFDSQYGGDSHDKFNAPGQAGKGLILPEDLLLADASMVFHLQQCRHTVCREEACLDDLHGCERPSGWNSSI